jgi:putative transposase
MPRKPREELDGAIHHVFARGNDRRAIYVDDADRRIYLATLGRVTRRQRWRCLAYCLMPNHVHLLVETPLANLGAGMQRLHGSYAHIFNERHGRSGHVFQGRYGAVRITTDEQLGAVAAYVALNPVVAGLCDQPDRWAWSSHAATLGARRKQPWLDVARLLSFLEGLGGDPFERYAAITAHGPDAGQVEEAPAAATVSRR